MPEFYLCPIISSILEALRKQYIQETQMNGYIITLELAELGPNNSTGFSDKAGLDYVFDAQNP